MRKTGLNFPPSLSEHRLFGSRFRLALPKVPWKLFICTIAPAHQSWHNPGKAYASTSQLEPLC